MPRSRKCFSAAVVLFVGCMHSSQVTWRIDNPDAMKQTLLQHVPPGTPSQRAKEFVEREGFTCALEKNGIFYERRGWRRHDVGIKHEGIDFLECRRVQNAGDLFMSHVWSVALVMHNGVVADVLVGHYIDGP